MRPFRVSQNLNLNVSEKRDESREKVGMRQKRKANEMRDRLKPESSLKQRLGWFDPPDFLNFLLGCSLDLLQNKLNQNGSSI